MHACHLCIVYAGICVGPLQVHALCEDDSVLGRAFYVMDYVPGRSAHPVGAWLVSPPSGWPVRSAYPVGACSVSSPSRCLFGQLTQ